MVNAARRPAKRRRAAPTPPPAPTWDAIAAAVGIDIRRLYRLRHEPGAPSTPNVEEWRVFAAIHEASSPSGPKQRSPAELAREAADLRFAEARARQAERDDAIASKQLVTKDQALAAAGAVRDAFITEGEMLAGAVLSLVPKLAKSERDAVENAVRAAWAAACNRIAAGMRHA